MASLKKELQGIIKSFKGDICPYSLIENACRRLGRKSSNAERRLRPSESPDVQSVKNKKGFIVGYKSIQTEPNGQIILL